MVDVGGLHLMAHLDERSEQFVYLLCGKQE